MLDKSKLGKRYTCFKCGSKFYDLNKPEPLCPDCNADQREAPVQDIRALLGSGKVVRRYEEDEEVEEFADDEAEEDAEEDDDDADLLDDLDGDEEEEEPEEEF